MVHIKSTASLDGEKLGGLAGSTGVWGHFRSSLTPWHGKEMAFNQSGTGSDAHHLAFLNKYQWNGRQGIIWQFEQGLFVLSLEPSHYLHFQGFHGWGAEGNHLKENSDTSQPSLHLSHFQDVNIYKIHLFKIAPVLSSLLQDRLHQQGYTIQLWWASRNIHIKQITIFHH